MREKVIRAFVDKETKKSYNTGYIFESDDKKRIEELKEKGFLYKEPVEEEGAEPESEKEESSEEEIEYPRDTGGGWYELSDGTKTQGKKEAIKAQEELDKEG